MRAIAEPIAAIWPSDGQAPSSELSERVGRRGQKISGDTMLMFALGCVVGFIAFPIVIFLASATIAINGWMT